MPGGTVSRLARRTNRWMALGLAVAALGSLAGAQAAMAADLLPNLQTRGPYDLRTTDESGRRLLRFTNETPNKGPGVLDVRPHAGNDCDGDGDPTNDRKAYQRIYRD